MYNSFYPDMEIGVLGELWYIKKYPHMFASKTTKEALDIAHYSYFDLHVINTIPTKKAEIKFDIAALKTGNIHVELFRGDKKTKSGIHVAKNNNVEYWITLVSSYDADKKRIVETSETCVYLFLVPELYDFTMEYWENHPECLKPSNSSWGACIPIGELEVICHNDILSYTLMTKDNIPYRKVKGVCV